MTQPLRILLSNDDGINASGLKVLEKIARTLSDDVWVVAPEVEQSGAGHSLTINRPLRARKISDKRFCVDGTPTDCMMVAINKLMRDQLPDLVLSGVNKGGNLAEAVTYSGTVAAAMEATLLGMPAIALSQVKTDGHPTRWGTAEHFAPDIIRQLVAAGWPANVLININFPDVPVASVAGVRLVHQGLRTIVDGLVDGLDPRGRPYFWIGAPRNHAPNASNTDLQAIHDKCIAITPLHLDLTHEATLKDLQKVFPCA
ncbi:MAG: 5'/3'-nucleotidase SurE [Holosporales bacterium]